MNWGFSRSLIFCELKYKHPIRFDFVAAKPCGIPNSSVTHCSLCTSPWCIFFFFFTNLSLPQQKTTPSLTSICCEGLWEEERKDGGGRKDRGYVQDRKMGCWREEKRREEKRREEKRREEVFSAPAGTKLLRTPLLKTRLS